MYHLEHTFRLYVWQIWHNINQVEFFQRDVHVINHTACYVIIIMCVYLYRGYPFKKNGKKNKEIVKKKKKKKKGFWSVNLQGIHCGHETALFLAPTCHWQVRLTPGPWAEAAQAPETLSLKSCWRGVQSPSVSVLPPEIMCAKRATAAQLGGNTQYLLFLETIIIPFFALFTHFDHFFWRITLHKFLRTQGQLPLVV